MNEPLRILLVEDSPTDAERALEALAWGGGPPIEVERSEDLAQALDRLRKGKFDAVLLDLNLPDSEGLGTLSLLRGVAPDLPVVILTGVQDERSALEAMRGGAEDYLVKDSYTPQSLVRSIRFAIERRRASRGGPPTPPIPPEDLRRHLDLLEAEHALLTRLLWGGTGGGTSEGVGVGKVLQGRYRIERELGSGSTGTTYEGWDLLLDRRVALKVLERRKARSEEGIRSFLKEARLQATLDHPRIVRVFDFGFVGEVPFLVVEYAEGGTLESLLRRRGTLPPLEVKGLACGILEGLSIVHSRGVLHRDLKPSNILFRKEGEVVLGDFGLALLADPEETQEGLSAPFRGTPLYAPPESFLGATLSPSSDLYSLGVVLYEALTGSPPFPWRGDFLDLRRRVLEDPPPPLPSSIDPVLSRVVLQALEKDPPRRPKSAEEMKNLLEGLRNA